MSPKVTYERGILMDRRQIAEEWGLTKSQARAFSHHIARKYGVVRLPGMSTRVFYRRADVEREMHNAGAMGDE